MTAGPRGLLLDVGGVLVLPRQERVSAALAAVGAPHDPSRIDAAHYSGIAAIDEPDVPAAERSTVYRAAFVVAVDVPRSLRGLASEALAAAFRAPGAWSRAAPGAVELLTACAANDLPVGIVSNWDGTVARLLAEAAICQVGPGPLPKVGVIIDSAVVGWEKPDPRIFGAALDALGVGPAETIHVGDSVRTDVDGAFATGIEPLHLDPIGRCADESHGNVPSLGRVAARLGFDFPSAQVV